MRILEGRVFVVDMRMTWDDMIWDDMTWYDMRLYDMIWYGMIWDYMIWYDMIWYDMIWYDMGWYDMGWCEDVLQFCSTGWWPYSWSTTQDMSVIDILIYSNMSRQVNEKRMTWRNVNEIRTIWENAKLKEDVMRKCAIKRGRLIWGNAKKRGRYEEIQN